MAVLPKLNQDPTLEAVDRAIEAKGNDETPRRYLGMSSIGRPCERELWYGFRWCSLPSFDADSLKRFDDGHHGEDVQAERLRLVDGITMLTTDPRKPGEQFGYSDLGGHFCGHMDGAILGLLQAPKTWHVWEHKQTAENKLNKLAKLKDENGEKLALAEWDETYHSQAVLYMHYSDIDRHYLTDSTPGGRKTISCRTDKDPVKAKELITKAKRIINANEPPPGISDNPGWYQCKWCSHQDVCHDDAVPEVNCRTCCHATPIIDGENGEWRCARHNNLAIPEEFQRVGCEDHVFIPALIHWAKTIDASPDDNWVEYELPTKVRFRNGSGKGCFSSIEIKAGGKALMADENIHKLKNDYEAVIVENS